MGRKAMLYEEHLEIQAERGFGVVSACDHETLRAPDALNFGPTLRRKLVAKGTCENIEVGRTRRLPSAYAEDGD